MSACSILGGGADEEVEALQEQINQMATQNALLLEQVEGSNDEGVQAPPPPNEETQPQVSIATPTSESLPDQPVPAGVPIIYDGWSLLVSKNIKIEAWGSTAPLIYITIILKNLGVDDRVFRYSNSAISLKDNLGNSYPPYPGFDVNHYNCEEDHYTLINLTIEGEDSETFEGHPRDCTDEDNFHVFEGPVPMEVSQLILMLNDFGPFTGIEVVIDL
jgi:hypothetical protein